ncbi:MAG TPA: DUF4043 family protein, partial [Nevskiaceae bacterium]|nr:DUF4043 family protein [Nevskiaceae bacterium]
HDTRMDVMDATIRWLVDLEDNLFMIHAAGARGTQQSTAWVVPLDSDSDFAAIAGQQQPTPPTRNRYSIPGGTATGLDNIDTTCTLDLDFLTGIRAKINTSNVPLSPVSSTQLNGNGAVNGNSQLLVGLLSEEQWMTLKTATGDNSFTQMVLAANTRMDFNKHPAFADLERFLWAGILWFKCPRAIEFAQGASAKQYNATTGALETVTVAQRAHRGLVLGAQAIGVAYGDSNPPTSGARAGNGGTGTTSILKSPYSWREDVRQGGGVIDIYGRMMGGYKKLVYSWPDPVTGTLTPFDNGVYAFDTYQAGL